MNLVRMTFGAKFFEMSPSWNLDVWNFENLIEPVLPNCGNGLGDDVFPVDRFQSIDRFLLCPPDHLHDDLRSDGEG